MAVFQEQKKNKKEEKSDTTQQTYDKEIAAQLRRVAGAQRFENRDPVYHLAESFCTTFDLVGRLSAAQVLHEEQGMPETPVGEHRDMDGTSFSTSMTEQVAGGFLKRFSETAFQNGILSGAILQGKGKTVLLSCIRRSAGYAGPTQNHQMRSLDDTSVTRRIPQTPDRVIVNSGELYSAVGLVIQSTKQATRTLQTIQKAAAGKQSPLMQPDAQTITLKEMYPFLFDQEEQALLARLREKRAELQKKGAITGTQYRTVQNGIAKCEQVIQKKQQISLQFLTKLDQLRTNAITAQQIFSEPAFLHEAVAALQTDSLPDEDEQSDDNNANRDE